MNKMHAQKDAMDEKLMERMIRLEAVAGVLPSAFHEMNNHMTAISGYTELMLSERHEVDQTTSDLISIREAAGRNISIINILRKLAAGENDSVKFNPADAVADAAAVLDKAARNRKMKISVVKSEEMPPARGDRNDLSIAMILLLTGVMGASARGAEIEIKCSWAPFGDRIIITIEKTRCGYPDLDAVRLFEPDQQAGLSVDERLSFCRRILSGMGARLNTGQNDDGEMMYSIELQRFEETKSSSWVKTLKTAWAQGMTG